MAKKQAKRDTVNYNLKVGNKVVYKGTTNDLEKREAEHRRDGKEFTHIQQVGNKKTPEGADKVETDQLETYRKNHQGDNPEYNKTKNG